LVNGEFRPIAIQEPKVPAVIEPEGTQARSWFLGTGRVKTLSDQRAGRVQRRWSVEVYGDVSGTRTRTVIERRKGTIAGDRQAVNGVEMRH
jgi:hypothetical protein